ncbi:hypothetical protein Pan4_48 [Pseudanabaena phage Pan4]|nr:hypothetical protein Pan4_48 [Pseudanabaena phage Pan4]
MRHEVINWGVLFAPEVRDRWEGRVFFGAGPATVAKFTAGDAPAYLASPYTKIAQRGGKWAYDLSLAASAQAAREMGRLARCGVSAISPIVQSAEIVHFERALAAAGQMLDPLDANFWESWCRPLLNVSCAVVVPDIDGWAQSDGVFREVMWTLQETQRPVFFYAEARHD